MVNTTRILRDMCHAVGLCVYQPYGKAFNADLYRNGYSEAFGGVRPEVVLARDAGMVNVYPGIRDCHYTRWSVTSSGIEWCWRYVLAAKRDRTDVAREFKTAVAYRTYGETPEPGSVKIEDINKTVRIEKVKQ